MDSIVPGDAGTNGGMPRNGGRPSSLRGSQAAQPNPIKQFRLNVVDEPVTNMLDELEREAREEKLVLNKMGMDRAAALKAAQSDDRQDDGMKREVAHARQVQNVRTAQDISLRRVRRELDAKTCEEADRYDEALRRRDVVRHNVDAYFAHSRNTLSTFLTARKSQVGQQYGALSTTTAKQFQLDKVEWDRIAQQVEIHITAVRGLKNKIEAGEYVVLVSKLSKLGGQPFKWSLRSPQDPKSPPPCPLHNVLHPEEVRRACEVCQGWLGCTTATSHEGTPEAVEIPFDTSVFTFLPPRNSIKPYAAFVFELVRMPKKEGESAVTVGWGAFPVTNGQFTVVKGKFRTPLIRGAVGGQIEHYKKINDIISEDIESWVANLYFEVVPYPRECDGRGEFDIEAAINARKLGLTEREHGLDLSSANVNTLANVLAAQRGRPVMVSAAKTKTEVFTVSREGMNLGPAGETVTKSDVPKWMGGTKGENTWAQAASKTIKSFRRSLAHMPVFGGTSQSPARGGGDDTDAVAGESSFDESSFARDTTTPPPQAKPQGILKSTAILSRLPTEPSTGSRAGSDVGSQQQHFSTEDDSNDGSEAADSDNEMILNSGMDEKEEGQLLFDMIDANGDGELSKMELYVFLSKHPEVKERLGLESVAEFLAQVDGDNNGLVSKEEFAIAWASIASSSVDILGRGPSRMRSHSIMFEQTETNALFRGESSMGEAALFAEDSDAALMQNMGASSGGGFGSTERGGTIFAKIREMGKKGTQKRKVLIERAEKWNTYTSVINDTVEEEEINWTVQLHYCWRGILDELHLHKVVSLRFYYMLFVFLISLYLQLYVHGMGIYAAVRIMQLPTSKIDPTWWGLTISYDGNFTYAFQELFICVCAMLANVCLVGLLVGFGTFIQTMTGSLPDQISRFVYCLSLSYFFAPFLSLLLDHLEGHTPGSARPSDILRLIEFYHSNQYEPFFGVLTFVVLYLNASALLCVMNYRYTMNVHLNGILQDCFWRINVAGEHDLVIPHDLEVSFKELEYAARTAEQWRGQNGERRKTKVSVIITTDDGDAHYVSKQMHIVIYQLDCMKRDKHGKIPKSIYREFYVLADGCIVEARKQRKPRAIASDAQEAKPQDLGAVMALLKTKKTATMSL